METKHWLLQENEACEYAVGCKMMNCRGKDDNRSTKLSCGLRRGLLISEGYKVPVETR